MPHAEPPTTQVSSPPTRSFPLPDELTLQILSYLPPRSLFSISLVSRHLHSIAETRSIHLRARLHANLRRAKTNHDNARASSFTPHDCICNPKGVRTLHSPDSESRLLGASWDPETGEVWALLLWCSVYHGLSLQGKVYVYLHDKPKRTSKQVRIDVKELMGEDWEFEVGAMDASRTEVWETAERERMEKLELPEHYAIVGTEEKWKKWKRPFEEKGMVPLGLASRCNRKIGDMWLNGRHTEVYA